MSYVDLHLHLLPGVDDGAADEAESLAYARRMHAEGVREATVTPHIAPHVPLDVHSIPDRVARLQRRIDEEGLGVRLHAGGEIHPRSAPLLTPDQLECIAQGPPGRRWLLLEVPFAGVDDGFVAQCARLRGLGYGLLIAHPERAGDLLADGLDRLAPTLAEGALLQVNVCSLLGHHGLEVQETAVELLRNGLAHVIASDAHPGTREQTLRLGFDLAIRAGASSVQAWRLTQDHPRALLRAGMGVPVLAGPWAHTIRTLAA
jgi:protein-tyrosine phosphatase